MTYKEFLAESQRLQRAYIAEESQRMHKAEALWFDYKCHMSDIGLHPLTHEEIAARHDQLKQMAVQVEQTHGDTPGQRAMFKTVKP